MNLTPSIAIKFFRVSTNGVNENIMAAVEYIGGDGKPAIFQNPIESSSDRVPEAMQDLLIMLGVQLKTLLRGKMAMMPLNIVVPPPVEDLQAKVEAAQAEADKKLAEEVVAPESGVQEPPPAEAKGDVEAKNAEGC